MDAASVTERQADGILARPGELGSVARNIPQRRRV
jgi:hypothetical protein